MVNINEDDVIMVKATKLSSPPEWAEPRVAVVAFVSSDFCDACSASVTRLNVLSNGATE